MEEKNIQNLSENDQTGSDRSMQQHDAKEKYMQTDFNAQIGEADTWLDKAKTLVRQNKLAAFKRGEIRKQAKTLISSRFKDSGQTGYK